MIKFDLDKAAEILERTPSVLETMLSGLPDEWILNNEGPNTWSPYDIMGHLVYGEKVLWINRMEIILSEKPDRRFEPFDRFAHLKAGQNKTIVQLLEEFSRLRKKNLKDLQKKNLTYKELDKTGIHPELGEVTLRQLLAQWPVHDMVHTAQIARVMATQYKEEIGPWVASTSILRK